ncbi:prephenate dehydratase [Desulfovibrio inopinatus]|uniref:prephenate dehydratase n=1 Tax=Desulfovibrio inopinatus TaxID=102109 RepID=UPI00040C0233|nr:prephenate dehydratase [Desulfovibrio inopinatus]
MADEKRPLTAESKTPVLDDAYLARVRDEIDHIDDEVLALLNRRAKVSREVGRLKADSAEPVFKPFRETEVLQRLIEKSEGDLPEEHLRSIYREIMSSSRRLQRSQKVVYLGPEGTFSHFAGQAYLGRSAEFEPCNTIADVFAAVASREAELGVIPLENSLEGTVGQSLDLFLRYEVFVQAEVFCKISHALLSKAESAAGLTAVYSHPQPLAQCAGWLRQNLHSATLFPMDSTAASAAKVAHMEPNVAAIGHIKLAEMYNLNVLATHIEDLPDNWTRFLIIGPTETRAGNRDKTSILFSLPDKPGSLSSVLALLAKEGINITKLESRPLRSEKWKYVFFADLECDLNKDEYKEMLTVLRQGTHTLRVLGAYPAGTYIDVTSGGIVEKSSS